MELIRNQIIKFNGLVIDYLFRKYNLKKTCNLKKILSINKKNIVWVKNNTIIMSNVIINEHYKVNLDENKYTLITVLYKNIYYKKKQDKNICYLDAMTKKKINKLWSKLSKSINLDDNSIIISRKYYNKQNTNEKVFNCFDLLCFYPIEKTTNQYQKITNNYKIDSDMLEFDTDDFNKPELNTRKFLYNLKKCIGEYVDMNTIYIKNIIKKSWFMDIEYINDIFDNFKTFPISRDTSLLCMIGLCYFKEDLLRYDNLIVKRLNDFNEYDLLMLFLNKIDTTLCNRDENKLLIFHWSCADKVILEKSLMKYQDLWSLYNEKYKNNIIYVDLLKVVKKTVQLKSYSLKYVSNILLDYTYTSDCKNGLDAMCLIITNDQKLNKQIIKRRCKSLGSFKNMHDIIQYNKIDTQLLYVILKYFTKY